jgi:nucleotide-binding universal stress UspA family protein
MVTHNSPFIQTDKQRTIGRIAVGVDTRGRSVSALVWAVEEAEREGTALMLVSARRKATTTADPVGEHDLGALARRLTLADVDKREVVGEPVEALLRAAAEADLLTVGCRSMPATQRMVMGSTSRTVAQWAPVPVVVVPEAWMQPAMATAPIVAGVRPWEPDKASADGQDQEVLEFAFARAAALKVPLVVVSTWDIPTVYAWSAEDVERLRSEHDDALTERVAQWRDAYPEVQVEPRSIAEKPSQAIVEASRVAQLVVVGRHHSATLSGLLGSTARGVLHHSTRPVAVVPSGSREELIHDLDMQRVGTDRSWAPMF